MTKGVSHNHLVERFAAREGGARRPEHKDGFGQRSKTPDI